MVRAVYKFFCYGSTAEVQPIARYQYKDKIAYRRISNTRIQPLNGELFAARTVTNQELSLEYKSLLIPTESHKKSTDRAF